MISRFCRTLMIVSMLLTSMFLGLIGFDYEIVTEVEGGSTLNVWPTATGPGNYTKIQYAIDNATPGDTIRVWAGTYVENVIVNKTLTLIAKNTTHTIIDGKQLGSTLYIDTNWVNVSGFRVINSTNAYGYGGIHLKNANFCKIENNNVSSPNRVGIFMQNSHNNIIHNNTASFNSGNSQAGFHFRDSNNNTVTNNVMSYNWQGFFLINGVNNTISNNTASYNTDYGFTHAYSTNNFILDNTFQENVRYDIYIYGNSEAQCNTTIYNNTGSGDRPILFFNTSVNLKDVVASEIILCNADSSTLDNVTINGSDMIKNNVLLLERTDNSFFKNINSSNNLRGIHSSRSKNNQIENCDFNNNYYYGLYFLQSEDSVIRNCSMSNSEYHGIQLNYAENSELINNTINNNNQNGIELSSSPGTMVVDNEIISNGNIGITSGDYSNGEIINNTITFNDNRGIEIKSGNDFIIYNNNFDNNNISVVLFSDNGEIYNISIESNTINNSGIHGILLTDTASGDKIYNISVRDNFIDNSTIGINITSSGNDPYDILIQGNNITGSSDRGISLYNDQAELYNVTIKENHIEECNYGIYSYDAHNITIMRNNLMNNTNGIYLNASKDILIYHNNFIDNTIQSYDNINNVWNASYPTGGNYWSDYVGVDNYSGPGQNLSGRDDIGDSNYTDIAGGAGNIDEYPLMRQIVWWTDLEPEIILISPANNSLFERGEIIKFDIYDSNYDIKTLRYTVNGGFPRSFGVNYTIDTSSFWWDQLYIIEVFVEDLNGKTYSKKFYFNIDSNAPIIWFASPGNNSVIKPGTELDFSIFDNNINIATYSINSGLPSTFPSPYNISTTGWTEGDYIIEIFVDDTLGHTIRRTYNITVDSTNPIIILYSPLNNSVIQPGTIIDLEVVDDHVGVVNYSWGFGADQELNDPYNINTYSFVDGTLWLIVNAFDLAGNFVRANFSFTFDSIDPVIQLVTPSDEAYIQPGAIIDLNITDANLDIVNYTLNGGANQTLSPPHNISTAGWDDGEYVIQIYANDLAGHITVDSYKFTVDSTAPVISLVSPADKSIKKSGIDIVLSVTDLNILSVNYTVNDQVTFNLNSPYTISTVGWSDRDYTILVKAVDKAGNLQALSFEFTLDSKIPFIELISPEDESEITPGTKIYLNITDDHLESVNYSLNDGAAVTLSDPYEINTSTWADGDYKLVVNAIDAAGNSNSMTYTFTVKTIVIIISPEVLETEPEKGTEEVPVDTEVKITFSKEMNNTAVENSISVYPATDISDFGWNDNNTVLTITFASDLDYSTNYSIAISTNAKDTEGAPLFEQFTFWFTTKLDTDDDDIPDDIDTDDDGDGMTDVWETDYGFDRLDSTDAASDFDSDDLTNLEEFLNNTDPKNSDSDSDNVTDGDEVKIYNTKPKVADSDSDGYDDGEEISKGTDPNDSTDFPVEEVVEEDEEEEPADLTMMYAGVGIAVVIIVLVIIFFLFMRKKPEEEEEEEHEETSEEEAVEEEASAEEEVVEEGAEGEEVVEEEAPVEEEPPVEEKQPVEEGVVSEEEKSEETEEEDEAEEFECPDCNFPITAADTVCPNCGAEFEEDEE